MEDRARKLVAAIRGENSGYNRRKPESPNIVGTQFPRQNKRGTALIFHGLTRPPPHSLSQQTTRSPPPRPCAPPTVPCHTSPAHWLSDTKFSATSGRKISIVTAPLVITSHLCPSRQDVQNLIFSLLFSSIKTVAPWFTKLLGVFRPSSCRGRRTEDYCQVLVCIKNHHHRN